MEPISSAKARSSFSDMLAQAYYQNRSFVIQKSNRPMAILISVEEYAKLKDLDKPKKKSPTKRRKS